ncbi:ribokinase [Eubacterium aggregans]|uniref:ribokinase n=1 Tax=Eubacterium aggregans TaxID=81409 RepID=UPI003F35C5FB
MAAKILMVGSIMIDLILQMECVPDPSESVLGDSYKNAGDGKGSNSAVAASRVGADVAVYCTLGQDANGEALKGMLEAEGMDIEYMQLVEGLSTGMAVILLEKSGMNRIIIYKGANDSTSPDALAGAFAKAPQAVMMQLKIPLETNIAALEMAKEKGIITCLDAGPAQDYPLEKMKWLTIFSPNETETKAMVEILPVDEATCQEASKKLMERSDCRYVVLKMGDKSSYIYGEGIQELVPPYKVDCVDLTAAGDAFTGALVKMYVETGDILAAAKYANAVGGG